MFALSSPIQTSDSENLAKIEKHILTTYKDIIDNGNHSKQKTPREQIKKMPGKY